MDRCVRAFCYGKPEKEITVWISGQTEKDRRLLTRIIGAFADEINARMAEQDFATAEDIIKAGAALIEYSNIMQEAEESAEDAEIMEDDEDETTA